MLATASASAASPKHNAQSQLKKTLASIHNALKPLTTEADVYLIQQYEENHKLELKQLGDELLTMSLNDSNDLYTAQHQLGEITFFVFCTNCCQSAISSVHS